MSKILITKDAMCCSYLPIYGNKYNQTPNIDALAQQGTVFTNHHTCAGSTIMSNMCMFTGLFSYESELQDYYQTNMRFQGDTLFDKANKLGFETHIIWDIAWGKAKTVEYYDCYGRNTEIHQLEDLRQGVGGHYHRNSMIEVDEKKTNAAIMRIRDELQKIVDTGKKVFVWLHVPHVIYGRNGYGDDIQAFDQIVGIVREIFSDNQIYISADHGNMNGHKSKYCYGFDMYETVINIPLITPRVQGRSTIDYLTANVDLYQIIFENEPVERHYIYCDTAFYAQAHRKTAVLDGRYKYIYNKAEKTEEFYDLKNDPDEQTNLMYDFFYDEERGNVTQLQELYYNPDWEEIRKKRLELKNELFRIWKKGNWRQEFVPIMKYILKRKIKFRIQKQLFNIKQRV